jgi:hypothetical protein
VRKRIRDVTETAVPVANPASFLAQKILIHEQREYKDKAKDLLYLHDTIELFSETLDEWSELFRGVVEPKLHPRRVAELEVAARQAVWKSQRHDSGSRSHGRGTKIQSGKTR